MERKEKIIQLHFLKSSTKKALIYHEYVSAFFVYNRILN